MPKPLKRSKALQPWSHDHHHGLLLCWKIRMGLKSNIAPERISKYVRWFFREHLLPHFETEERYIFPLLGLENELIRRAVAEHGKLKALAEDAAWAPGTVGTLAARLDEHIRFEERILFPEIQQQASEEQLASVAAHHPELPFAENEEDRFWETS